MPNSKMKNETNNNHDESRYKYPPRGSDNTHTQQQQYHQSPVVTGPCIHADFTLTEHHTLRASFSCEVK
ncbi:hypothetical protein E2C01_024152 [Portunus trituberculatus]|uniref:Uncharacterized protein n=1 Tax=Portunus trituberculatus TaxID=210409 RepID=A0A5B7E9K7_PORTR|nr:hypothetical protein [Portunus trituberculatus]